MKFLICISLLLTSTAAVASGGYSGPVSITHGNDGVVRMVIERDAARFLYFSIKGPENQVPGFGYFRKINQTLTCYRFPNSGDTFLCRSEIVSGEVVRSR